MVRYRHLLAFGFVSLLGTLLPSSCPPCRANASMDCELIGSVSVELVQAGCMVKCATSPDPICCSVASALQSAATKGIAQKLAADGCEVVVEKSGTLLKLKIRGDAKRLERVERDLKTKAPKLDIKKKK
jgi:hypothetical protein